MRSPVEIWIREHKKAFEAVDTLVELLSPDNIQTELINPSNSALRSKLKSILNEIVEFDENHFKIEEELLIPALRDNFGSGIKDALSCMVREHEQMHAFVERIRVVLTELGSDMPLNAHTAAEIMRISYGAQSIIRHHCSKEERDIYPLVAKLPAKVVFDIMNKLGIEDSLNIDHLIKPLGPKSENSEELRGIESPEN